MIDEIVTAFGQTVEMFEDGVRNTTDLCWRNGFSNFLVPVRIAYHIMIGLEWFVSSLPEQEHRKARRLNLNWKGPVEALPDRRALLEDLAWMNDRITEWFSDWKRTFTRGGDCSYQLKKALYFLRHTQHHIGEYSATARLLDLERPRWIYADFTPDSIRNRPQNG
jgi:hypothetical protein